MYVFSPFFPFLELEILGGWVSYRKMRLMMEFISDGWFLE